MAFAFIVRRHVLFLNAIGEHAQGVLKQGVMLGDMIH